MPLDPAAARPGPPAGARQAAFLTLLPTVLTTARRHFRFVACPDRKADCVAETVALAWGWFVRLGERGRDPAPFANTFARLAAKAVGSGRRLCGQERADDVLSPVARRRHGFAVRPLPDAAPGSGPDLADALRDNTQSPVPAQAQFRLDFPAWAGRLPAAKRRILARLALGHQTRDVARMFGVTPARIAQLRGEFRRGYLAFLSDLADDGRRPPVRPPIPTPAPETHT